MKLLIADDEPLARQRLRDLIADLGGHDVLGEASNGREACEMAAHLRPDVVLIDIAMPVLDGLEAAQHIGTLDPAPAIVFCTAYDEHALAAFEANAVDYLVKPIRADRLATALDRARRFTSERLRAVGEALPQKPRRTHLSARLRGELRLIPVRDIRFLQAEEKYVVVHHAGGEDLVEDSLKALETEFVDAFVRVHRNCLVACSELKELGRDSQGRDLVRLRNDAHEIEVSRRCLPTLRQRMRTL